MIRILRLHTHTEAAYRYFFYVGGRESYGSYDMRFYRFRLKSR